MSAAPSRSEPGTSEGALVALLAAITALGAVTLNIFLPARPDAQEQLHASVAATGLTVSLAGVSYAFGLLAYGPWSDRYGRRPVMLFGLGLYGAGTLAAMLAGSMPMLIAARVAQAFGSAAGVTIGRAIVHDLFPVARMARTLAYLTMVVAVANALAPAAGALLTEWLHWRAVFALLLAAGVLVAIWALRKLPETHRPRAAQLPAERPLAIMASLAVKPAFATCALQSAVVFATFLVFASYMPYIMRNALGGSASSYGAWYLMIAAGYFLGNYAVTRHAARYGVVRLMRLGAMIQSAAALFALALAMLHYWHPLAVFGPWMVLAFAQGLILPNVTAAAVSLAPLAAGAAAGLLGFVQQMVSSAAVQAMSSVPLDSPVPVSLFIAIASLVALGAAFAGSSTLTAPAPAGG